VNLKTYMLLSAVVVILGMVISAAPALIALLEAAVPLVIVVGIVVAVLRLVWHFTDGYR
jgi:hypothetical protein